MFTGIFIDSFAISPYVERAESKLIWSIANSSSPFASPNILSELTYENIKQEGSGLQLSYLKVVDDVWAFKVEGDYSSSSIKSGDSQDSDYLFDDRQGEFSRSYADIEDDGAERRSLELGVKTRWFKSDSEGHYVSVMLGYQQQSIDITVTNGEQIIPEELNGEIIEGLNTTYNSEFSSKFLAVSTEHAFAWGVIGLRYEKHDVDFTAEADWNLRTDFQHPVSFEHEGDGEGRVLTLGYVYKFDFNLDVFFDITHREYEIIDGDDVTFFSDGGVGHTRLNRLVYKSNNARLGIRVVF